MTRTKAKALAAQVRDTLTLSPKLAAALFQVEATTVATADFERAAAVMGVSSSSVMEMYTGYNKIIVVLD